MSMKLAPAATLLLLLVVTLPAVALADGNATGNTTGNTTGAMAQNLTPVSVSQNATISVPTPANEGLMKVGTYENASVYVSGDANATVDGSVLEIAMGPAARMEYRDVYLFYRLPAGFASLSFDYDLQAGEKSNVLLVDFADSLPTIGVKKGGVPDTAVLGLGAWTSAYSTITGMDEIGGLKAFPQGAHNISIVPGNGMLFMMLDGNSTAFNYLSQKKYLVIHLMVGDENSSLAGTISDIRYDGPPLATETPSGGSLTGNGTGNDGNGSGTLNGSGGSVPGSPSGKPGGKPTPTPVPGTGSGISLGVLLALAAGIVFLAAWFFVYTRYLK